MTSAAHLAESASVDRVRKGLLDCDADALGLEVPVDLRIFQLYPYVCAPAQVIS